MENEFIKRMSKLDDKELFDILNNKGSYQEEAFNYAVNELNNRGFAKETAPALKEFEETKRIEILELERQQKLPELYSQKSIILFSAFFTAICGAIMMSYNFRKLENTEKSKSVLLFGFVYALLLMFLISLTDVNMIRLILQIGAMIGGFVLFLRYEKFYPTDLEHLNKPIWKILIYALIISISLISIMTYIYVKNNI
jgi:lipopolysaccharide export LptBFGC system permease protein LptF